MSATPTAALVEEAEKMAVRALDGTASREEKSVLFASLAAALRRAEAELDAATTQLAKKFKRLEELEKRAEQAEAERDAQHDLVLRLTAERDEAKADAVRMLTAASQPGITSARLAADLDEARAQVWGLICVATNCAIKADKGFPALRQVLDQRDELTATRDLLTAENARLQKEVATLELLRRGGK